MMKRYKITYFYKDRLCVSLFTQISKSNRSDETKISFHVDGRKYYQIKLKGGFLNGFCKNYNWANSRNYVFINYKKRNTQGIIIDFK